MRSELALSRSPVRYAGSRCVGDMLPCVTRRNSADDITSARAIPQIPVDPLPGRQHLVTPRARAANRIIRKWALDFHLCYGAAGNRTRCKKPHKLRKRRTLRREMTQPRGATCGYTLPATAWLSMTCPDEEVAALTALVDESSATLDQPAQTTRDAPRDAQQLSARIEPANWCRIHIVLVRK
jgi:hypothetical protein